MWTKKIQETSYTDEEYNATGVDEIVLRQRPITNTTTFSFSVRDNSLNQGNWDSVESTLYFVDDNSGVVYLTFNAYGRWKTI